MSLTALLVLRLSVITTESQDALNLFVLKKLKNRIQRILYDCTKAVSEDKLEVLINVLMHVLKQQLKQITKEGIIFLLENYLFGNMN